MHLMRSPFLVSLAMVGIAAPTALAQTVVLPNTAASSEGTSFTISLGPLGNSAYTNQFLYTSPLLATLSVGSQINGLRLRADGGDVTGTYPATNLVWSNYDITLAQAAVSLTAFGTLESNPTAHNMTNPQQVRSGSLTMNANSYIDNGAGPNPFGPLISFDTPYTYLGGDLVLLISHSTATGTIFHGDADAVGFGYNAGSTWAQRQFGGYQSPNVSVTTSGPVIELEFSAPVSSTPEPGSIALFSALGVTGIGFFARSRRRG